MWGNLDDSLLATPVELHPTTKKRVDFEMEAISLTLNISANSWSNLVSKDSFEISSPWWFQNRPWL